MHKVILKLDKFFLKYEGANHENHHKAVRLHDAFLKNMVESFQKKAFHGGQTFLGKNILGRLF